MTTSIVEPHPASGTTNAIADRFRAVYGTDPLRQFRAPGRVNLIGEHTDYNDGFVMPVAIDFYSYSAISVRADRRLYIHSTQFNETVDFDLDQLAEPPRKHWSDYVRGVAAVLRDEGYPLKGANILIDGHVPIGAGLSSSAAIEVVTALALTSLGGVTTPLLETVKLCQRAENVYTGTRCGIMDQFVSCFGKQDHALMLDCRSLDAIHLPLPSNIRLVICNTMVRHELAAGEYNERRASCDCAVKTLRSLRSDIRALRDLRLEDLDKHRSFLTDVDFRRARHVITENARVQEAMRALQESDLVKLGQLMYRSHQSLERDYEVTCRELNVMVDLSRDLDGVYGARMTGGGFGGCTINLVESRAVPEFSQCIARKYEEAMHISPQIFVTHAAGGASAA
jgi:galactokinase